MQYGAFLDIDPAGEFDEFVVAADDGTRPDAGVVRDDNVTDDDGRLGNISGVVDVRCYTG